MVDGQAVGGLDVAADDHQHVGPVQRGPHDAGSLLVPVGPEHDTAGGQEKIMRLRNYFYRVIPTTPLESRVTVLEEGRAGQSTKHRCSVGAEDSLLTLVQHEGSGVVFARHGDHGVAVVGHRAALVHRVASDGGGGVAGPVESVPAAVVRQALH